MQWEIKWLHKHYAMFANGPHFYLRYKSVAYTVCLGTECFAPDKTHAAPRHAHCGSLSITGNNHSRAQNQRDLIKNQGKVLSRSVIDHPLTAGR